MFIPYSITITLLIIYTSSITILLVALIHSKKHSFILYDDLTKLYTRGSSLQLINNSLNHFKLPSNCENEIQSALLILDVDQFKRINDTYGHPIGDLVLSTISKIIKENIRYTDIAGRLGGDEFIIYMHRVSSVEDILDKATHINALIQNNETLVASVDQVTVSIGIAFAPIHGKDFDTLYKHADTALYHSKKSGKNQTNIYLSE